MTSRTFLFSILLFLSSLMILGGAINVGESGQFFTILFFIPFFLCLKVFQQKTKKKILVVLAILYILFIWDHGSNRIIYPLIGSEVTLNDQWGYVSYDDSGIKSLSVPGDQNRKVGKYVRSVGDFNESKALEMVRMSVSYPSFRMTFSPIFRDQAGSEYRIFAESLEEEIEKGTVLSSEFKGLKHYQYQSTFSYWLSFVAGWPLLLFIAIAK